MPDPFAYGLGECDHCNASGDVREVLEGTHPVLGDLYLLLCSECAESWDDQ